MATAEPLITVACEKCGHASRVVAAFAGQAGKCPKCREVVVVPDAATAAALEEARARAAAEAKAVADALAVGGPDGAPDAQTDLLAPPGDPDDQRPCRACGKPIRRAAIKCRHCGDLAEQPCPSCGEPIKVTAKKCRHCGEFLDATVRARRRLEDDGHTLAEPRQRLVAWVIDVALRVPYYVAGGAWVGFQEANQDAAAIGAAALGAAWLLVLTVVEWSMIVRAGQTPGKRLMGIRIIRTDGAKVDFVHGVILRNWIYAVVGNPLFLSIMAMIVWIVDGVMILAADRRSLRDHLASTKVVLVDPPAA